MFIQSHTENEYWVVGARYDHVDYIWRNAARYDDARWMNMHGRFIQPPHFEFGPFATHDEAAACLAANQHLSREEL